MKLFIFAFFAAVVCLNGTFGCPCQETRKPNKDSKALACDGNGACGCGCGGESPWV